MARPDSEMLIRATRIIGDMLRRAEHIDGVEFTLYEPEGDDQYIDIDLMVDDNPIDYEIRISLAAALPLSI